MFSILMDSYLKLEARSFVFICAMKIGKFFLQDIRDESQEGEISCTRVCLHQYDVTSDNLRLVLARLLPALGDTETRTTSAPPGNEAATLHSEAIWGSIKT